MFPIYVNHTLKVKKVHRAKGKSGPYENRRSYITHRDNLRNVALENFYGDKCTEVEHMN